MNKILKIAACWLIAIAAYTQPLLRSEALLMQSKEHYDKALICDKMFNEAADKSKVETDGKKRHSLMLQAMLALHRANLHRQACIELLAASIEARNEEQASRVSDEGEM